MVLDTIVSTERGSEIIIVHIFDMMGNMMGHKKTVCLDVGAYRFREPALPGLLLLSTVK